jgi:hypothetical protein
MRKKIQPKLPKRQPTILNISNVATPKGKLSLKQKDNSFQKIVFTEVLDSIESVNSNTDVDLFEIKNSFLYLTLDRENFPKVLVKALNFFETTEEFEKCGRCKKLLESIKI